MIARCAFAIGAFCAALVFLGDHTGHAAGTDAVPRFEPAECPKQQPKALAVAKCGYLVVRENRSQPNGRTIRLIVAIIPALSDEPAPDPVVYLVGGPGGIALGEADLVVTAGFNRDRNLILMNQRGTFETDPELLCPAIDAFGRELLGLRYYSEETKRIHLAATETCRRTLATTGVDLSAYNSTESAADFADLRTILDYDTYNVLGVSYGSYLAQVLMRDHPEGIRSIVLDSVVPAAVTIPGFWGNTHAGFDDLFAACTNDAACNSAHPHLEDTFTALVNRLEAEPLTPTVNDPATGDPIEITIDGGALIDWLRNQSYYTPLLRAVPRLIDGLAAGKAETIEAIAKDRAARAPPPRSGTPAVGYGLSLGVACREWVPPASQEEWANDGRAAFPNYPVSIQVEAVGTWAYTREDCREVWKVPAAPPALHEPVKSSIPTLLISGSFDAVTSLAWAEAAAKHLSRATIISIPGVGHFTSLYSPCAQGVIASFLANPNAAPDTSCVAGLSPPHFD